MPVMKAQMARSASSGAIVMDLADMEREGTRIVAEAQAQAQKIIADARAAAQRDAQAIREAARQAGHNDGFAAGREAGAKQGHDEALAQVAQNLAELTSRWSQTLDLFQQHMPLHLADARTDLVRLAVAIAARVTHEEALRNRTVAQATAQETLRLVSSARKVVLHVHPDELATLEKYLPELVAGARTIDAIELEPDERLTPGGCEMHFGAGWIDASLETQIERIANELLSGE